MLDAFAGSGALSFEALSRGAAAAHLFERDRAALAALEGNVQALGLSANVARVHRRDVLKNPPISARPPFDLVFLDPPYAFDAADVLGMVAQLAAAGALDDDALVVYEHASRLPAIPWTAPPPRWASRLHRARSTAILSWTSSDARSAGRPPGEDGRRRALAHAAAF